jgi:hypothetical protein
MKYILVRFLAAAMPIEVAKCVFDSFLVLKRTLEFCLPPDENSD